VRLQVERRLELYQQQRLLQPGTSIKTIAANLWLLLFFMPAEGHLMSKKNNYRKFIPQKIMGLSKSLFYRKRK